jgi:hypothetical protein
MQKTGFEELLRLRFFSTLNNFHFPPSILTY